MEETERRDEARRALEGAEWTAKREEEEKARAAAAETQSLEGRLAAVHAEKEKLELAWIDLDDKRKAVRALLNPLLDEEKKLEAEETKLEAEEASTGVPQSRHEVETKRWPVQAKRQDIEKRKWAEEEKLVEVDKIVAANTKRYRELLTEEDQLMSRRDELRLHG